MAKVEANHKVNDTFPGLIGEYVEEQERDYFFDYNRKTLNDIGADEYYQGKPKLSEVHEVSFDNDGREEKRHRCQLFLIDDEAEEFLQININLKAPGDIQKGVHYKSSLYKLIGGIMEQIQPGWTQDHNMIAQTNLAEFRRYINELESMTVFIREEAGSNFDYYTFKVTEVQ